MIQLFYRNWKKASQTGNASPRINSIEGRMVR
jgi:hypothetical protein